MAALLVLMSVAAMAQAANPPAASTPDRATPDRATSGKATPGSKANAAASTEPQAKTKAEFDAYEAAMELTETASVEAAAVEFAQRFPASGLRPYLFQRAMGLYERAGDPSKTLEMARAVLKYDPSNAVALMTAAQLLAEHTHNDDLDHVERLTEAVTDARGALQHAGEMMQPDGLSKAEYAASLGQLRGGAHEALGTVAFKRSEYKDAIREYYEATVEKKGQNPALVWLRLAISREKSGDYEPALADVQRAIDVSEPEGPVRTMAEKEKVRLEELMAFRPMDGQSGPHAEGAGGEIH
jgi:tetratricopeptide (TPR) repeat protein